MLPSLTNTTVRGKFTENPYGEEFSRAKSLDTIFEKTKIKFVNTNIKKSLNQWMDNNLKNTYAT